MSNKKLYKNKAWLEEQYITLGKEASQIANEQGCNYGVIFNWLHKFDIPLRRKVRLDKDWLIDQYLIKLKSCIEIGNEFGYNPERVRRSLISYNIKIRSLSEAHSGRVGWSKGLTKETDERVWNLSQGLLNSKKYPELRTRMLGKNNPMYGNHSMSGENNPMFGKGYLISGERNGMYGRKGELSPTFGRKLTKEQIKVWQKGCHDQYKGNTRLTKPEKIMYKYIVLFSNWEYSGDRSFWIEFRNGKKKNPDFKNMKEQKVIEVFGDYWHNENEVQPLLEAYREVGWDCVIIWEHEIKNINNNERFLELLSEDNRYIYDDRYEDDKDVL